MTLRKMFQGIPKDAVRTDKTFHTSRPTDRGPFAEAQVHSGATESRVFLNGTDVTEDYLEWVRKQPKEHSVTFTWIEGETDDNN